MLQGTASPFDMGYGGVAQRPGAEPGTRTYGAAVGSTRAALSQVSSPGDAPFVITMYDTP